MPTINKSKLILPWAKPKTQAEQRRSAEDYIFLNTAAWRKLSTVYRRAHPLCEVCIKGGCVPVQPSAHVDHVVARGEHGGAELDWANLMAICISHHSTKTILERAGRLCPVVDTGSGFVPGDRQMVIDKILGK